MKKVYGNIDTLVGFEEQNHIADLRRQTQTGLTPTASGLGDTHLADRKRRGQSGRPGNRGPVGGLETIYLTKIQKGRGQTAMN